MYDVLKTGSVFVFMDMGQGHLLCMAPVFKTYTF